MIISYLFSSQNVKPVVLLLKQINLYYCRAEGLYTEQFVWLRYSILTRALFFNLHRRLWKPAAYSLVLEKRLLSHDEWRSCRYRTILIIRVVKAKRSTLTERRSIKVRRIWRMGHVNRTSITNIYEPLRIFKQQNINASKKIYTKFIIRNYSQKVN